MSESQKKTIPKFKKKLQGFLSDESGKITKEDVLKMGMVAMGVGGMIPDIVSAHSAGHGSHYGGNAPSNGHASGIGGWCNGSGPWLFSNTVNGHASGSGIAGGSCYGGTPGHGSSTHGSHGSHGSHGQW